MGIQLRYIGNTTSFVLTNGKIYELLSVEKGWYRVKDDTNEDYLYPADLFEIVLDDESVCWQENDNLNYERINKFCRMAQEDIEFLIKRLEDAIRARLEKEK